LSWQMTVKRHRITLFLTVAFFLLVATLFIVGWQGASHLHRLESRMEKAVYKKWQNQLLIHEAFRLSDENSRLTLLVFLMDDPNEISRTLDQRSQNTARISELVKAIRPGLGTEEEKRLFAAVEATRSPYVKSYQQALALLLTEHKRDEARQMMLITVRPNLITYHDAWNAFDQFEAAEINQAVFQSRAEYAVEQRTFVLTLVLANLIAGAIALFTVVRMHRETAERRRAEQALQEAHAQLELRVQERTAKLEAANKEIESFSYSVSHDLRAPLRHIQGYVEMLQRTTEGQLSDKARRFLKTISDASEDMGRLIDDLLSFSRLGRTEKQETIVDLNQMVQDTRRRLEMATLDRNIMWKIAPLPPALGDPAMLNQVLFNLIGNAVKYSRARDPAEIEISCTGEESGRLVFKVHDNGAGFDMQYADKLFGVFQRLHRPEDFEGTGIGLATVRRILTRHGDRVWAESELDKGATFYFTLKPATAV
jgi:signal transduction histidine kinase